MLQFIFFAVFWSVFKLMSLKFGNLNSVSERSIVQDGMVVSVFLFIYFLWLFVLAPSNFSEADTHGAIIEQGHITAYGYRVKLQEIRACAVVDVSYLALTNIVLGYLGKTGRT